MREYIDSIKKLFESIDMNHSKKLFNSFFHNDSEGHLLVIEGEPGDGKLYHTKELLSSLNIHYTLISGKCGFKPLIEYFKKNENLVFDDCESTFADLQCFHALKGASEGQINLHVNNKPEIIHFTKKIIIITNGEDMADKLHAKLHLYSHDLFSNNDDSE